jgi:PIN domain nuclease of toxin-antitoxin system
MQLLLDTHTFLWFLEGNNNLSIKARKSIESPENLKFVSIASIWELAIKLNLGKLTLDIGLQGLKNELLKNNFEILPLDFEHISTLTKLEAIHKDPFDRIIISQAITENLTLISMDANFSSYKSLKLLW